MICKICNSFFFTKKSLLTLFNEEKEFICKNCQNKYVLDITIHNIELDIYKAGVISMFKEKYYINYEAFYNEYSKLFQTIIKYEDYNVMFLDFLDPDDNTLEVLDAISKLFDRNLLILTFYLKDK